MRISLTTIVVDRFHAGHTDRDFSEPFAPGATKCVGNNDRNVELEMFF